MIPRWPSETISHSVTFTVAGAVHATVSIGGVAASFTSTDPDLANDTAISTVRLG
jgi:hypothetical protein